MPKFKLEYTQTMIEHWEVEIEADREEEIREMFHNGECVNDNAILTDSVFLSDEIKEITKVDE